MAPFCQERDLRGVTKRVQFRGVVRAACSLNADISHTQILRMGGDKLIFMLIKVLSGPGLLLIEVLGSF